MSFDLSAPVSMSAEIGSECGLGEVVGWSRVLLGFSSVELAAVGVVSGVAIGSGRSIRKAKRRSRERERVQSIVLRTSMKIVLWISLLCFPLPFH